MNSRRLGRSGIAIAPIVLGGNVFGWTADKQTSFDVLDRFAEAGLQAIDTANAYSAWVPGNRGGESESIIGEWMQNRRRRESTVIITKVGAEVGPGRKGLSRAHILEEVDASLQRLRTDYIDVYLSHRPDPIVPYEETLAAFEVLLKSGKVRDIGASNLSAEQLQAALDVSAANGLPRYSVLQPEYHLMARQKFEGPLSALTQAEDIDVIPYFGLAKGFLTGKYRSEADLGKSTRGGGVKEYLNERGYRVLAALDDVAAAHQAQPAEIALAWLIQRPGITAPIASATSVAQVESLVRAATLELTASDVERLDSASEVAG